jgi:hypothetical protein
MFTPKIIHHEDGGPVEPAFPPGEPELELPGELTLLADRLSREAARLAERYPAEKARPAQEAPSGQIIETIERAASPSVGRKGAYRFLAPALALIVAVSASAGLLWRHGVNQESDQASGAKTLWDAAFRPEDPLLSGRSRAGNRPLAPGPAVVPARASTPASFVHELTGPEMEGVLDLLERSEDVDPRLSI